jgi:hypothetical protein
VEVDLSEAEAEGVSQVVVRSGESSVRITGEAGL